MEKMFSRVRKSSEQIIIGENSSSDENCEDLNNSRVLIRRRPANMQKYVRIRRVEDVIISDSDTSSSDERQSQDQENSRCLLNFNQYRENSKTLLLTPTNKFQPLSVTLSGGKIATTQSAAPQIKRLNRGNNSICGTPLTTCRTAWHSLRNTLSTLKRDRRSVLQETLEDTFIECTPLLSIEANLRTLVDKQVMSNSSRVTTSVRRKQRCIKGGYLQEYKCLMQKVRMDRRSLNHNQRLGINPGHRVLVLSICESFGVHMARVQVAEGDETIFNLILSQGMAPRICVGSFLELYFDLQLETPLKLRNKELVYIQPNKLVLL